MPNTALSARTSIHMYINQQVKPAFVCLFCLDVTIHETIHNNNNNNNNNNNFARIGIVFNVAGCLIRERRSWSVNSHFPRGLHFSDLFLEFGIKGHFKRENLTSFLVG